MEPIACPEASVRNYRYTLRPIPEERSSHPIVVSGRTVQGMGLQPLGYWDRGFESR